MVWEDELFARHRWGQHGENAARRERVHLRSLWDEIQAPGETFIRFVEQVIGPEICNWRLEEMILLLCGAIGTKQSPFEQSGGSAASVSHLERLFNTDAVRRAAIY